MFRGMYARGCTCGIQCTRFQRCVLGQLGGVSGIPMSENYFGLRGDIGFEILQNERECLELPIYIKTCVCICLSVCTQAMSEGYKWLALFYWQCHRFTNTGMLFLFEGVIWGNK